MGNSKGEVGFEYWWRWQVLVCALIIYVPAAVCLVVIKRGLKSGKPLSHGCLWVPCWRGMSPKWLLLYRAFAFISMAWVLYKSNKMIASLGHIAYYFYTQWTFTLVTVYFAIATIISARGCWLNMEKAPTRDDKFLNNRYTEARSTTDASVKGKAEVGGNLHKHFNLDQAEEQAGFWGHLMHIVYQVSAGASILTDTVFWCVLVPMLSGKDFQLTLLLGLVHALNIVVLIVDSSLNNLPFQWSGFPYYGWWSVLYITFQWVIHACGSTRWPYPFLELATPWAPMWYLGMALFHIPCYGIYVILMKAMVSGFSKLFPRAYMRLNEGTLQQEKTA